MGYGAYMTVKNLRSRDIRLFITDVECMHDGTEGSNLSLFNDAIVTAHTNLPSESGQYIEADGGGGCWFHTSRFTLKIEDAPSVTIIGHVAFADGDKEWDYTNDNEAVIDVFVVNNHQATITVSVEET